MKLAVSNIAWNSDCDEEMFSFLKKEGYLGLEIAPIRTFGENAFKQIDKAKIFASKLQKEYGLEICSMQSILAGEESNIFKSDYERKNIFDKISLCAYFAGSINVGNIVFGCPRNRKYENNFDKQIAKVFFCDIAEVANNNKTTIALEPVSAIYGNNFLISTKEVASFIRETENKYLKMNLDLGAIISNNEDIEVIFDNIDLINHIHISEPYLAKLQKREMHKCLKLEGYDKFISIEVKNTNNLEDIKDNIEYIREILA